jgi:hypothetical protein
VSYKWQELLTLREQQKDNPEKNGNIDEENKRKTTQHVLDIIVRKQTQIT